MFMALHTKLGVYTLNVIYILNRRTNNTVECAEHALLLLSASVVFCFKCQKFAYENQQKKQ